MAKCKSYGEAMHGSWMNRAVADKDRTRMIGRVVTTRERGEQQNCGGKARESHGLTTNHSAAAMAKARRRRWTWRRGGWAGRGRRRGGAGGARKGGRGLPARAGRGLHPRPKRCAPASWPSRTASRRAARSTPRPPGAARSGRSPGASLASTSGPSSPGRDCGRPRRAARGGRPGGC